MNEKQYNLLKKSVKYWNRYRMMYPRAIIDLSSANLRSADLLSANLSSANLRSANLSSADLSSAKYSILAIFRAKITSISDELTIELMRHDAEFTGMDKMTAWAKGGECPYKGMERDFIFLEKKELWVEGTPTHRGLDLWRWIAKEQNIKISV